MPKGPQSGRDAQRAAEIQQGPRQAEALLILGPQRRVAQVNRALPWIEQGYRCFNFKFGARVRRAGKPRARTRLTDSGDSLRQLVPVSRILRKIILGSGKEIVANKIDRSSGG